MLDNRVRAVLERLEREDAAEREAGLPASERARQVVRTTGQFLFALVAPQTDCEVLELGGSRGYSTIWLAAGVRQLGGRVLSFENDPRKIEAWHRSVEEAGLAEWAELVEGDALELLPSLASGPARLLRRREAERSDPRERHRPARPRARAVRRLALTARFAIFRVPRKGGGPAVISSSTGSGGTSG